jgi:hypothetical protein
MLVCIAGITYTILALRTFLNSLSHSLCMYMVGGVHVCWVVQNYHWQPLVEYKIPVISYLDMVCPFAMPPPPGGKSPPQHAKSAFWGPNLHHGAEFHQFTAVVLAHAIHEYALNDISETSLDGDLPSWLPHQDAISKQQIADWNTYVYNTSTDAALDLDTKTIKCSMEPLQSITKVLEHGSDWSYYEDVRGKPGWICASKGDGKALLSSRTTGHRTAPRRRPARTEQPTASTRISPRSLSLSVLLLRVQPIIKMSVLMSYDPRMGALRCCIEPYGRKYCHIIDTLWTDQTSQIMTVDMTFPDLPDHTSTSVLQRSLICSANNGKVKIVEVKTC